jgi:hypothetical protein
LSSPGAPRAGVAGQITFAVVGFDFGDHTRCFAPIWPASHEKFSQQRSRVRHGSLFGPRFRFDYPPHGL